MSTETKSNVASAEHNGTVALRWIDAFNARDDAAEAAARTTDAAGPARRRGPAVASTAPGLGGYPAVGEDAAHGPS